MNIRSFLVSAFVVISILLGSVAPVEAVSRAGDPVYFPETGHTLAFSFRAFYDRQGGLPIFGLPLTEVFLEDGRPVQYFERARFEWHAESYSVAAGHLGRWAASKSNSPAFVPVGAAPAGARYFSEVGHSLGGEFLQFWQRNGGLATFGYPISEPFEEQALDGQIYTVQYFERSRFEYHPEAPANARVQLSHLGRQYLAEHPAPAEALAPVQSAAQAWDLVRPTHISIPRIGIDVSVIEIAFGPGVDDVPRYSAGHYWEFGAMPNTTGNIVIAGHVGYRGIIFNRLPEAQVGDDIYLQVNGQTRHYRVNEILTVLPTDVWVLHHTNQETLTLITCVPFGVYTHRLIVRATPVV